MKQRIQNVTQFRRAINRSLAHVVVDAPDKPLVEVTRRSAELLYRGWREAGLDVFVEREDHATAHHIRTTITCEEKSP